MELTLHNSPAFHFSLDLEVLETEVNRYHHVGYEKYFYYFHQACVGYFAMIGHTVGEDNTGIDLIAAETRCVYKRELCLGDQIKIECQVGEIKPKAVIMNFQINRDGNICATGSTTYLFFNYQTKAVVGVPDALAELINAYEGLKQ